MDYERDEETLERIIDNLLTYGIDLFNRYGKEYSMDDNPITESEFKNTKESTLDVDGLWEYMKGC